MASVIKPIVISLLLVSLFAIALINFIVGIQTDNNSDTLLTDNPLFSNYKNNLTNEVSNNYGNSSSAYGAISNSTVSTTGAFAYLDAIGGIWKTIVSAPINTYNLTIGLLLTNLFGDENAVIIRNVLGAILTIMIIFAVVFLITRGEAG